MQNICTTCVNMADSCYRCGGSIYYTCDICQGRKWGKAPVYPCVNCNGTGLLKCGRCVVSVSKPTYVADPITYTGTRCSQGCREGTCSVCGKLGCNHVGFLQNADTGVVYCSRSCYNQDQCIMM